MKKLIPALFTTVGLIAATQTIAQNKFNLKQADKYEMNMMMKVNMTQEMMGQTMDITSNTNLVNTIAVKQADANGFLLTNTLAKMKMSGAAMGQEMSYDSENPADKDSQIGQVMGDKIGTTTEVSFDSNGKLISVKKDPKEKDNAAGGMGSMMGIGSDDNKGGLGLFLANFNNGSVKVGDTWTDSTGDKETKSVTAYTVKDIKDDKTVVSFVSTITLSKTQETNGMEIVVNMTGKVNGESTYDKNGILTQSTSNTEMTGTTEVMGNSIPMTNKMLTIITVKKQ